MQPDDIDDPDRAAIIPGGLDTFPDGGQQILEDDQFSAVDIPEDTFDDNSVVLNPEEPPPAARL